MQCVPLGGGAFSAMDPMRTLTQLKVDLEIDNFDEFKSVKNSVIDFQLIATTVLLPHVVSNNYSRSEKSIRKSGSSDHKPKISMARDSSYKPKIRL